MSQSSRRSFLKSSAVAASTVFAAPWIARASGPSVAKLGVAVVGVNGRGSSHIGAYLGDERTEIRTIVDVDEVVGNKRCEEIEKKQGFRPKLITDMRRAFEDDSIDIVSTATPNH